MKQDEYLEYLDDAIEHREKELEQAKDWNLDTFTPLESYSHGWKTAALRILKECKKMYLALYEREGK